MPPDSYVYVACPLCFLCLLHVSELERGYLPSYNVPYFREIYEMSGYPMLDRRRNRRIGSEYQLAPRAKILR